MGWNGSDKEQVKNQGEGEQRKGKLRSSTSTSNFNYKVLIVGLIVVIVVGLSAYFMLGRSVTTSADGGGFGAARPATISEVKPQITTNKIDQAAAPEKSREKTRAEIMMEGRDTNKWMYVKNPLTGEEYVARVFRPTDQFKTKVLYKNQALNELDGILFSDMSDELVGVTIDKKFMDNLQQALIDGVEQSGDDDEDTSARKAEMKSTLDTLKASLKDGEDIQSMIKDALREHRKVAALKDQMKEQRRIMRDEGASAQEIEDFEDACNKMLEEKGASPMITHRSFSKRMQEKEETNNNN